MENDILYTKFNRTRLDQRVPYIFILIPHYDRSETGMYPDERNLRRFIITEFNKKYNIDVFNDFYENDQVRNMKLWELGEARYTYSKVHGSVFSIRILVFRRKDGTDMEEWRKGAHSASILYGKQASLWTEEDEKISEDVFQLQENDFGSYLDYSKFCIHFQKFINFDYFSIKNTLEGLNIIPLRKDNVVFLEHYKWSRSYLLAENGLYDFEGTDREYIYQKNLFDKPYYLNYFEYHQQKQRYNLGPFDKFTPMPPRLTLGFTDYFKGHNIATYKDDELDIMREINVEAFPLFEIVYDLPVWGFYDFEIPYQFIELPEDQDDPIFADDVYPRGKFLKQLKEYLIQDFDIKNILDKNSPEWWLYLLEGMETNTNVFISEYYKKRGNHIGAKWCAYLK